MKININKYLYTNKNPPEMNNARVKYGCIKAERHETSNVRKEILQSIYVTFQKLNQLKFSNPGKSKKYSHWKRYWCLQSWYLFTSFFFL